MSELVLLKITDRIAEVQFNRPEKNNALNLDMFQAIADVIDRIAEQKQLRVVVLSGIGKHFCAGADIASLSSISMAHSEPSNLIPRYRENANLFQYVACGWKNLPVPVVAAVQGVALGGGFQIALAADIRYASPDARFSAMEIKWGLIPDMGISQTLPGLVREDVASELLFTGCVIDAKEAERIGLLTRICEHPYSHAMEAARAIASKNPQAIKAGKKLISHCWNNSGSGTGLLLESELQERLSGSPNQLEAIAAELENREPDYQEE